MSDQGGSKWCTCEKLEDKACRDYLSWVTDGDRINDTNVQWLLAHSYDGVNWGRLGDDHSWFLSSAAFPEVSPVISAANLLELRLFGEDSEILIWRTEEGFSGRCLTDETDNNDPCRPDKETRVLLGDRMSPDPDHKLQNPVNGFTCVETARGLQQAIPVVCSKEDFTGGRWPLRLEVKHYFEQDEETGVVRVAASRLVNVYKEV